MQIFFLHGSFERVVCIRGLAFKAQYAKSAMTPKSAMRNAPILRIALFFARPLVCIFDCRILLTRRILKGPKSALFGPETAILDPQKSVEDFEPPHLDHLRPLQSDSPRAVSGVVEVQNLDFDADFGPFCRFSKMIPTFCPNAGINGLNVKKHIWNRDTGDANILFEQTGLFGLRCFNIHIL